MLLLAVGYFEADRRSVPDAQRPGYCPLRCQKPPCSNEAQRGGGDGAGKYPEVAPCRPQLEFYRTCYAPRLKRSFSFLLKMLISLDCKNLLKFA